MLALLCCCLLCPVLSAEDRVVTQGNAVLIEGDGKGPPAPAAAPSISQSVSASLQAQAGLPPSPAPSLTALEEEKIEDEQQDYNERRAWGFFVVREGMTYEEVEKLAAANGIRRQNKRTEPGMGQLQSEMIVEYEYRGKKQVFRKIVAFDAMNRTVLRVTDNIEPRA
jgi:hypothetical protein